jgi:uncharacterized protein (DUF983 family)
VADPPVSSLRVALTCCCPRCGRGRLYRNLLQVRDRCTACGLDLRENDTGDGAAALVTLVLGALIVVLAVWVEVRFSPPLWVHALVWPIVTVPLAVLMTRTVKAALVAQQYRYRTSEMGL